MAMVHKLPEGKNSNTIIISIFAARKKSQINEYYKGRNRRFNGNN